MPSIRVLILGDLFVTCDVYQAAITEIFKQTSIGLSFVRYTDEWPVRPLESTSEVREFVGDENEIAALADGAEVILTHSAPVTRRVLDAAADLRAIGAARGGPLNVNVQACTERGVPVFFAPGSKGAAVAEFAVGLMLAESRNIARCHLSMAESTQWRGDLYEYSRASHELGGATVGLIGFGAIGRHVASILNGFGSKVLVYDPLVQPEEIRRLGGEPVDLDNLLTEADFISLHARLTRESQNMLGRRELGLMKPSAFLINTARAELVEQEALLDVLKSHKIGGAALDVFWDEPPPANSPLYEMNNVTLSSHLGGASKKAAERGAQIASEEVFRFLSKTATPRYCMNPEVLRSR